MNELTADAIRAILVFVKLLTKFSFVSRRNMLLFLQLMFAMSECTSIAVGAGLFLDPALAQLCLDFELVVPGHDATISFKSKWILAHSERILR